MCRLDKLWTQTDSCLTQTDSCLTIESVDVEHEPRTGSQWPPRVRVDSQNHGHKSNPVWQIEIVDVEHEPRSAKIPDRLFSGCSWEVNAWPWDTVQRLVYFQQNKKRRKPKVKIVTLQLCGVRKDISYMKNSPHVPLRPITEEKRRGKEGLWVIRIPSHSTVCLIGSPLEQGCSLIYTFWLVIKTHKRGAKRVV